jgi:hypothetical protein
MSEVLGFVCSHTLCENSAEAFCTQGCQLAYCGHHFDTEDGRCTTCVDKDRCDNFWTSLILGILAVLVFWRILLK